MPRKAQPSRPISHIYFTLTRFLHETERPDSTNAMHGWNEDDWLAAGLICHIHGIAPLVDAYLRDPAFEGVFDHHFCAFVAEQRRVHGIRAGRIMALADTLAEPLAAHNRPPLLLKGSYLLKHYYRDRTLRPMADLDLMVDADDAACAIRILEQRDYRIFSESADGLTLMRSSEIGLAADGNEGMCGGPAADDLYLAESEATPIAVDVHFRVRMHLRMNVIDLTSLLAAGDERGEGQSTRVALMMHLLLHNVKNMVEHRHRLIQLYDIWLLAADLTEQDWSAIAVYCRTFNCQSQVSLIMQVVRTVFGAGDGRLDPWFNRSESRASGLDVAAHLLKYSCCNPHQIRMLDILRLCGSNRQRLHFLSYLLDSRHKGRVQNSFGEGVNHTRRKRNVFARTGRYFSRKGNRPGFRGFELLGFDAAQV